MSEDDVRRGISQARQNEVAGGLYLLVLIFASSAIGTYFGSTPAGFITFLVLLVGVWLPRVGPAFGMVAGVIFAVFVFNLAGGAGLWAVVAAVIAFMAGAGSGLGANQWAQDTTRRR